MSGHQMLATGTQPAGHVSAEALLALGASVPTQPSGRGHLLPPGIPAISCHVLPLPAPRSCEVRALCARSISGRTALPVPTASQAGGRLPPPPPNLDPTSHLYKGICLPLGAEPGTGMAWKGAAMSDVHLPFNIKPTSCLRLPALLSSLQKDEKMGRLVFSRRARSCGGVCGQCWERGGCMTTHPIYHPSTHPAAAAPYLSSQHWRGPCQRLEQKKLVSVSPPQPFSQPVGPGC